MVWLRVGDRAAESRAPDVLWFVLVALALAPFVVGLFAVALGDYRPVTDHALIELRTRDVFTGDTPLVGPYSRFGWNHPGPLLFWLLAVPYELWGESANALLGGALMVNALAVAGIAVVAWRRGGLVLSAWLLSLTGVLSLSLGGQVLRSPWNPYVTVLPFVLFVLLIWSVVDGDLWAAPFAILVASFLTQTHVAYALTCSVLLACAAVVVALRLWRRRSEPDKAAQRAQLLRVLAVSSVVAAVLWLPSVLEQVTADTGNLTEMWRFSAEGHPTAGITSGYETVASQLAPWAPWLGAAEPTGAFTGQVLNDSAPWFPLTAIALIASGFAAFHRGARSATLLCAVVAVAIAVSVVAVSRIVDLVYPYLVRWLWGLGALTFGAIGWDIWSALRSELRNRFRPIVVGALAVAVAVLAGAGVVSAVRADDPADDPAGGDLVDQLLASHTLAGMGPVLIEGDYAGLGLALERRGFDVHYPDRDEPRVGAHRTVQDLNPATTLVVLSDGAIDRGLADPELELVAYYDTLPVGKRQRLERLVRAEIEVQADLYEPGYLTVVEAVKVPNLDDETLRAEVSEAIDSLKQRRFAVFTVATVRTRQGT